jgi:hypothetical protein
LTSAGSSFGWTVGTALAMDDGGSGDVSDATIDATFADVAAVVVAGPVVVVGVPAKVEVDVGDRAPAAGKATLKGAWSPFYESVFGRNLRAKLQRQLHKQQKLVRFL